MIVRYESLCELRDYARSLRDEYKVATSEAERTIVTDKLQAYVDNRFVERYSEDADYNAKVLTGFLIEAYENDEQEGAYSPLVSWVDTNYIERGLYCMTLNDHADFQQLLFEYGSSFFYLEPEKNNRLLVEMYKIIAKNSRHKANKPQRS